MSKLLLDPINQSDIEDYLSNYADFSFELRVLKEFIDLGLQCSHSGTYDDPVTGKGREYDIRALLQDNIARINLSVECKNIRDNFPLVVHCLERKENESYNELIYTFDPYSTRHDSLKPTTVAQPNFSRSIRVSTQHSLYSQGNYVAKSADQVGRRQHDGEITATDGGIFEKISQAISTAYDLIKEAHYLDTGETTPYLTFVCPVLIIPDSTLWQVKYSDSGVRTGGPEQINHISYYVEKEWTVGGELSLLTYTISHLEVVTFSEIRNFVENYLRTYINHILSSGFVKEFLPGLITK